MLRRTRKRVLVVVTLIGMKDNDVKFLQPGHRLTSRVCGRQCAVRGCELGPLLGGNDAVYGEQSYHYQICEQVWPRLL